MPTILTSSQFKNILSKWKKFGGKVITSETRSWYRE